MCTSITWEGHVTEALWDLYVHGGRMVLCGAISTYNKSAESNVIPNPLSAQTSNTLATLSPQPHAGSFPPPTPTLPLPQSLPLPPRACHTQLLSVRCVSSRAVAYT